MNDSRPKGWLTNLEVEEVSLVPVGAAQGSRMLFAKADTGAGSSLSRAWASFRKFFTGDGEALLAPASEPATEDPPRTVAQIMSAHEFWEEWVELREALEQSICEIMASGDADKPALLRQTVSEFLEALEEKLGEVSEGEGEFVQKMDSALSVLVEVLPATGNGTDVQKALDALEQSAGKPTGPQSPAAPPQEREMKTAKELLSEMSAEDVATLEKFYKEMYATKAEAEGTPADDAEDKAEVAKSAEVPAEVRKALEAKDAEITAVRKALETEREIRVTKEITAEVGSYSLPGLDSAKAVSVIKAAQAGKPVSVEDLRTMFKATTEVVKAHDAIMRQMGSAAGMDAADRPVASEVTRLAKAWLDANPTVKGSPEARMAAAKAAVYDMHPELAAAEMGEG